MFSPVVQQQRLAYEHVNNVSEDSRSALRLPLERHSRQIPYRQSHTNISAADSGACGFQSAFQRDYMHKDPSQRDHVSARFDADEHMLRRKTPNGTLAAAYDGRAQDWASVPPAAKMLRHSQKASDLGWYRQFPTSQLIDNTGPNVQESWLPPLSNNPYSWQGNMRVPTVLQPIWQPAPGPTASNPTQFYGPYWPDGSYAPYKPASVRDLYRYNAGDSNDFHGDGMDLYNGIQDTVYIGQQQNIMPYTFGDDHYLQHDSSQTLLPVSTDRLGGFNSSMDHHGAATILSGRGANHQFKDKVLVWAQKVYVDLLTQLQGSDARLSHRRRSSGHPRSHSQPNIYPSPPKKAHESPHAEYHTLGAIHRTGGRDAANTDSNHERRHSNAATGSLSNGRFLAPSARPSRMPDLHRYDTSPAYLGSSVSQAGRVNSATDQAKVALEMLNNLCQESQWSWIDGMLLGGCLAYGLENYDMAMKWYSRIISIDANHVEAISNLAATLLALNQREEAEQHWLRAVRLRPSYFEAVEHLIGLLCGDQRSNEAVSLLDFVEKSLRVQKQDDQTDQRSDASSDEERSLFCSPSFTPSSEHAIFDFDMNCSNCPISGRRESLNVHTGFGISGYKIAATENGRMLALVHAKGNLLYGLGDIDGAARSFENAVLISTGRRQSGLRGLIEKILRVVSVDDRLGYHHHHRSQASVHIPGSVPILLSPDMALRTASLVFAPLGELPGLKHLPEGMARKAALSTTSNSLLSLAKIFQDSLSSTGSSVPTRQKPAGIGDILALYYLSLSLQPSPSTANNVGILLASVQQPTASKRQSFNRTSIPSIPGVIPGSGVALALAYYNYGLNLDSRHAHLFTNLGSLLKDIGQLNAAIKMYEQAVSCDGTFDIALANLANAVKDQGRISDAINYYKRAVASNPDFAEAVCGLANALNSVCEWTDRGGVILERGQFERWHVDAKGMIFDSKIRGIGSGWMKRVVDIVGKQLTEGSNWGRGTLQEHVIRSMMTQLELADSGVRWSGEKAASIRAKIASWAGKGWEGARVVRITERAVKRAMHRWYRDRFILNKQMPESSYPRPVLPSGLSMPGAPTVLPFHTFTCPLSAKDIRMISERNALRISCSTLRSSWLPANVYPPPAPPRPCLNIGYVSSDFNNHPLAHLMQSVFGLHDVSKAKAICYATTPSDNSIHRQQIEREAPVFHDASSWSADRLIQQIVADGVHILVNLNGYTRGARNEIFAARPAPIQMSFMGFAGTLGAEWCDYLLADEIAIPPETLRPWRRNIEIEDQIFEDENPQEDQWVYSENIIYCRDTFFCCDHRQSSKDAQLPWIEEQHRRWRMRKELFPNLPDSAIILGNFNQLYKIEPTTFRTWLRILAKIPRAILWLLRFPDLGESNLKKTARAWAGEDVASRIWFTDVAPKGQHISRARVCDLFLDTPECNAHTTAADVLWSSTPLLTLPRYKYKMCSRMAASILTGALPRSVEGRQAGKELIARDEEQYEEFAINLASGLSYDSTGIGMGRLVEIRKLLYESRHTAALFDTQRWVRDLEKAYAIAWSNWVQGKGGDIYL